MYVMAVVSRVDGRKPTHVNTFALLDGEALNDGAVAADDRLAEGQERVLRGLASEHGDG
jgi:hypothetical protein